MIIYFADKQLRIKGSASTTLKGGLRLFDDLTVEEVDPGVSSFSCKISYNDLSRRELEEAAVAGNFILKGTGAAFDHQENTYDSLYTILETEFDTEAQELTLYAEDAGLDLLNKVVPPVKLSGYSCWGMINYFKPSDWNIRTVGVPTSTKTHEWEGENTCIERLKSIANLFGCEIYYSFVVERMAISQKIINVVNKRGNQKATAQLRLNKEINSIVTKTSIADLATAYQVTGGIPDKKTTPINLKNYTWEQIDSDTQDVYRVDKSTGQMRNVSAMKRWASVIDKDGLIIKRFEYDTTSQATLAAQAKAELKKHCKPEVNYEVDFVSLPEGTRVGDRINIIDDDGELYLDARILTLETSAADQTVAAVLGEYIIKKSGISDKVMEIASQFADLSKQRQFYTWIAYADTDTGEGLSLESEGKSYVGIVPNMLEELTDLEQITDVSIFKWSLFQSAQLRITAEEGTVYKGKRISTRLIVNVYRGTTVISNITELKALFGMDAKLNWYETINGEESAITSTDPRLTVGGFVLHVDSDKDYEHFKCELEV